MNTKSFFKPHSLMSIHGYNSFGNWQRKLEEALTNTNIQGFHFKYGRRIIVWPSLVSKIVKQFRDWYFSITDNIKYNIDISEPYHRPSIIAHSLGSWILVKAMERFPEIKFDKIILVGSIIPNDYDWINLIVKGQINNIVCEVSEKIR